MRQYGGIIIVADHDCVDREILYILAIDILNNQIRASKTACGNAATPSVKRLALTTREVLVVGGAHTRLRRRTFLVYIRKIMVLEE